MVSLPILLLVCFFVSITNGFTLTVVDKLVLDKDSILVSEVIQYVPFGWPSELPCLLASRLKEVNLHNNSKYEWRVRYEPSSRDDSIANNNSTQSTFEVDGNRLLIQKADTQMDQAVFECAIVRPRNTTLISRTRLHLQDCRIDKRYSDPCFYGKCIRESSRIHCGCFRLFTGLYCHKFKSDAWFTAFGPLLITLVAVLACSVSIFAYACCDSKRKEEQLMEITKNVGFADRCDLSFEQLYRFQRRIRVCRYDSDEDPEGKEKKDEPVQEEEEKKKKAKESKVIGRRKGKKDKRSKEKEEEEEKEKEEEKSEQKDKTEQKEEDSEKKKRMKKMDEMEEKKGDEESMTTQTVSTRGPQ